MTDRNMARSQIGGMVFVALLFAWNTFNAPGPTPRYFSAAMVVVFTSVAVWKFQRYRQQTRAVR